MPASRALKRLTTEAYINLATFRRNGKAVETPVWFAILGGKLYVVTDGTSAKVKRIRATKRVRLAACNVWGGVTRGLDRRHGAGPQGAEAHRARARRSAEEVRLADVAARYERRACLVASAAGRISSCPWGPRLRLLSKAAPPAACATLRCRRPAAATGMAPSVAGYVDRHSGFVTRCGSVLSPEGDDSRAGHGARPSGGHNGRLHAG